MKHLHDQARQAKTQAKTLATGAFATALALAPLLSTGGCSGQKFEQRTVNVAVGDTFSSPRAVKWKTTKIDDDGVELSCLSLDTVVRVRYHNAISVCIVETPETTEVQTILVERNVPPMAHIVVFDQLDIGPDGKHLPAGK